jgi:putative ABC transport system ATP-binding protein
VRWQRTSAIKEQMPPADSTSPTFAFEDVSVAFGDTSVLHHLNLVVPNQGITVVVGPSGSGKSTLARLCNRLIDPTSGVVRFRGADLHDLDVLELRQRVGLVFQRPAIFPGDTSDNLSVTGVTDQDRHREILTSVGLNSKTLLDREASALSGGESQRLCLARTLLKEPEVLVADEPTASLDHHAARALEELITQTARSGIPVLWVTHDLTQLDRLGNHGVVLVDGRVLATGTPQELRENIDPRVQDFLSTGTRSGDSQTGIDLEPPAANEI